MTAGRPLRDVEVRIRRTIAGRISRDEATSFADLISPRDSIDPKTKKHVSTKTIVYEGPPCGGPPPARGFVVSARGDSVRAEIEATLRVDSDIEGRIENGYSEAFISVDPTGRIKGVEVRERVSKL